jgi:centrosomal protein CEP44
MSEVALSSKCRALRTDLRDMRYANYWNEAEVLTGNPVMYLRVLHVLFLEYSPELKKFIIDRGYTLQTATDMSFFEQLLRLLQIEYNYRSKLPVANFFKPKFALQKLTLCCDIARLVKERYRPPQNGHM